MSILLEALRKSEKDRLKSSPPDIHSGELPDPESGTPRKRLLVILFIVVVSLVTWIAWQQYGTQGSTDMVAFNTVGESDQPAAQPEKSGSETDDQSQLKPAKAAAKGATGQARTPVESLKQPGKQSSEPSASANKIASRATPYIISTPSNQGDRGGNQKSAAKTPVSQMVAKETPASANAAGNKSAANKTAANKSANKKPAAKQAAKAGSTEPDKKGFRPEPPPPIGYWDLPDSIRSNVPEIKYSVLVYANDPSDRFVLINGERLKEGDVVSAGLKVKEIRRDGIIFKYRLYEFLVEK